MIQPKSPRRRNGQRDRDGYRDRHEARENDFSNSSCFVVVTETRGRY